MEFFRRAAGSPRALGVFPGAFNPPTRAHVALARAALGNVEELVFVLPREFPHKAYEGARFEDRVRMLDAALADESRFSIATTRGGLFLEIARECRETYGPLPELHFLCGRDAAERILNWDYGSPGAFLEQLREYRLLVAPRQGLFAPPAELISRVQALTPGEDCDELSATAVRERIARGEPWEHLVPESIVEIVRGVYADPG